MKRIWTRRGDVRMARVGAVKIGEDTVEKPRLFSTFYSGCNTPQINPLSNIFEEVK